jgi:hypothetical protein
MFVLFKTTLVPLQMMTANAPDDCAPMASKIFNSSVSQTVVVAFLAVPKQLGRGIVSHLYLAIVNEW